MLYGLVWGTEYGRFTPINVSKHENLARNEIWSIYSKYEHLARKINRIYVHLVCPLWFSAFFAVISLPCHHCYSCCKTK